MASRSRLSRLIDAPPHRRCFGALAILEVGLVVLALASTPLAPAALASAALAWLGGVAGWTLVEYLLHRFAFHLPRAHPLSRLGARQHLDHHDAPDRAPITKPMHLTLPAIGVAAASAWLVGPMALAVVSGLVAGYLAYELLHVAAHVLPRDHPFPALQRGHLQHHRDPGAWFGITSPVWDHVMGTKGPGACNRPRR